MRFLSPKNLNFGGHILPFFQTPSHIMYISMYFKETCYLNIRETFLKLVPNIIKVILDNLEVRNSSSHDIHDRVLNCHATLTN